MKTQKPVAKGSIYMALALDLRLHMWTLVKTRKQSLRGLREDLSTWRVLALDLLRLHASKPSNHMWSAFMLPTPPQCLYQAPPGAQQLALPDFSNMAHFGHVMASVLVLTGVVIGARTISFRSGVDRRDAYWCLVVEVQTCGDIDPNMSFLLAFERTQADPHSFCLNDPAVCQCQNM